jgi:phosphoribosylaminoimidazole carboxylase (NCAIR synthetase)
MRKAFPTVGIIGAGPLARMFISPAADLGIELQIFEDDPKDLNTVRAFAMKCDVVTFADDQSPLSIIKTLEAEGIAFRPTSAVFENSYNKGIKGQTIDFDYEITVMVARSPHGQVATWAPTQTVQEDGICMMTITPAPQLSEAMSERAQMLALDIAAEVGVIGVMAVEIFVQDEMLIVSRLVMRPHVSGNWTIEGARTSQFEQHLRAVLDLPLGDPSVTTSVAVVGNVVAGNKSDMYRPYLHLMARTPALKFHQYKVDARPGAVVGHVTLLGKNSSELIDEVQHALEYMSGEIDE